MVRKPGSHLYQYNFIELDNKLQCILITGASKNNESQCSCALTVGIGGICDPGDRQGLAHFLEHMLFMGSQKFPGEKEFGQFITNNGGDSNAQTGTECTTYVFDVENSALEEALERFGDMLAAPLIREECIAKEIQAVESEFQMNKEVDLNRRNSILFSTLNDQHPLNCFYWGNAESLAQDGLCQAVQEFYHEYYSANIMRLCIFAPGYGFKKLQRIVRECFSGIANKQVQRPFAGISPPDISNNGVMYCITPVKDTRICQITWFMPSIWHLHQSRPDRVITSLLAHESAGSILYMLKQRQFATGLNVDTILENTQFSSSISITIKLTSEGFENLQEVLSIVFSYVNLLHSTPSFSPYYQELQTVGQLEFDYSEIKDHSEYVSNISEALMYFTEENAIKSGVYGVIDQCNDEDVRFLLQYITFASARIDVTAPEYADSIDQHEKWFGTGYSIKPLPEHIITDTILENLHLPEINDLIASDFQMLPNSSAPSNVYSSEMVNTWLCVDTSFHVPKANAYISLLLPNFREGIEEYVKADLIAMVLQNDINDEFGYKAMEAGFSIDINALESALEISVSGFSHKICLLLERIIEFIYTFTPSENRIQLMSQKLLQRYKNANLDPNNHSRNARLLFLQHNEFSETEKYEALRKISQEDLQYDLSTVKIMMFIHGNVSQEEVIGVSEFTDGLLYAAEATRILEVSPRTVLLLPEKTIEWRINAVNPDNPNSVLEIYYQLGQAGVEERALTQLLEQIIQEDMFDELRTEQQLGYYVEASYKFTRGVNGLQVKICSAEYSPDVLQERVNEFLDDLFEDLSEDFEQHRTSVISRIREPWYSLSDKADDFWNEIFQGYLEFDRKQKEIEYLAKLKCKDFKKWLKDSAFRRKVLVIKVFARKWGEQVDEFTEQFNQNPEAVRSEYPCYSWLSILHQEPSNQTQHCISVYKWRGGCLYQARLQLQQRAIWLINIYI